MISMGIKQTCDVRGASDDWVDRGQLIHLHCFTGSRVMVQRWLEVFPILVLQLMFRSSTRKRQWPSVWSPRTGC